MSGTGAPLAWGPWALTESRGRVITSPEERERAKSQPPAKVRQAARQGRKGAGRGKQAGRSLGRRRRWRRKRSKRRQ